MSRRTYGFIASLAGAALGVWYWRRRRGVADYGEHGTVIFDNTPSSAAEGVI